MSEGLRDPKSLGQNRVGRKYTLSVDRWVVIRPTLDSGSIEKVHYLVAACSWRNENGKKGESRPICEGREFKTQGGKGAPVVRDQGTPESETLGEDIQLSYSDRTWQFRQFCVDSEGNCLATFVEAKVLPLSQLFD